MGYFCRKTCCQNLSNIAQSGHTGLATFAGFMSNLLIWKRHNLSKKTFQFKTLQRLLGQNVILFSLSFSGKNDATE